MSDLEPEAPVAPHRRPGLVALLYAHRALTGIAVAVPAAAAVGAATAPYPHAQGELFDAGGLMLFASVRLARRAAPAVTYGALTVTLIAAAVGLIPLALLLAGLSRPGPPAARASAHAGTLALLFGLGLAAQVVAAILIGLVGGKIVSATHAVPPTEDLAMLGVILVVLTAVAVIGVIRDLASAAAVHGDHRLYVATSRALRAMAQRPLRTFFAWLWRAALGFAAIALAAWAAPSARAAGTAAIVLGFVIHQLALAGGTYARASWLAAAIRTLDATAPVPETIVASDPPEQATTE